MAEERHLDYKTLYLPEENYKRIKYLSSKEEEKNYHLTIGYSDLGAFLTPLSVYKFQDNIKKFRKSVFDRYLGYCAITRGLNNWSIKHLNIGLKTFVDIDNPGELQIVSKY